jgi:hypothetical protein
MSGHALTAILSAAAEVVGFSLVLREAWRLRREELGHVSRLRKLWNDLKETIENPVTAGDERAWWDLGSRYSVQDTSLSSDEVSGPSLLDQVIRLERHLDALAARAQTIEQRVQAVAGEFDAHAAATQAARRSDIGRRVRGETVGASIFLIGVALNLAANLIR